MRGSQNLTICSAIFADAVSISCDLKNLPIWLLKPRAQRVIHFVRRSFSNEPNQTPLGDFPFGTPVTSYDSTSLNETERDTIARCLTRSDADFGLLVRIPKWGNRKRFLVQREKYIPANYTKDDAENPGRAKVISQRHNNGVWPFSERLATSGVWQGK